LDDLRHDASIEDGRVHIAAVLVRDLEARTQAMVICPGGAYRVLASNHEGRQVAAYLNSLGRSTTIRSSWETRSVRSDCREHEHLNGGSTRLAWASWGSRRAGISP
jgi:hypothetical protein